MKKTAAIQLPTLTDEEAEHLLDALFDLANIVQAYYELNPGNPPPEDIPEDAEWTSGTVDLFKDEIPF